MDSRKTQKVVVVILVLTALLGIGGAFLVYYFSTQDDIARVDREDRQYCGCITAYTTPDCNSCDCTRIESQALKSTIGEIVDGECTLDCEPEEEGNTIKCPIPQVRESNCHSVSVKDPSTNDLIIPPIPTDRPIRITADFVPREIAGEEESFTKYVFIINGVTTEIDSQDVTSTMVDGQKTYSPEIEFDNFQDINTLTIQAIGYSNIEPDGEASGKYCYRQYDLTQRRDSLCSSLNAYTKAEQTGETIRLSRLELKIPNVDLEKNISLEFNFDHQDLPTVRTATLPSDLIEEIVADETIFLEEALLYSTPELYVQSEGFPTLNSTELDVRNISLSTQVYVDNTPIDSSLCQDNISLVTITEPEEDIEIPEEIEEPILVEESEVEVAMEGPSCVRKAENEDETSRTNYRIIITNNSENEEEVTQITNKLPLGFRYVEGTTVIDEVSVEDNILDVTAIGESQELIWRDSWSIPAESYLILEYGVNVTHNAIDGENQNEVIITPTNIPEDMDGLRAEFVTLVSDECEHEEELPDTGNLTYISFFVGVIAFLFGILVYQGRIKSIDSTMLKIIGTRAIKKRIMTPQEYLEDSILEEEDED